MRRIVRPQCRVEAPRNFHPNSFDSSAQGRGVAISVAGNEIVFFTDVRAQTHETPTPDQAIYLSGSARPLAHRLILSNKPLITGWAACVLCSLTMRHAVLRIFPVEFILCLFTQVRSLKTVISPWSKKKYESSRSTPLSTRWNIATTSFQNNRLELRVTET